MNILNPRRVGVALTIGIVCAAGVSHAQEHAHEHDSYTSRCAHLDVSLSGGATAIWSADLSAAARWGRDNPVVRLDPGKAPGLAVELEADAFFGGAHWVLEREFHDLEAEQPVDVAIDLGKLWGLHEQQLIADTLVRVTVYEVDDDGRRVGRRAVLPDLLAREDGRGRMSVRLHLSADSDPLPPDAPTFDDSQIQALETRLRARYTDPDKN